MTDHGVDEDPRLWPPTDLELAYRDWSHKREAARDAYLAIRARLYRRELHLERRTPPTPSKPWLEKIQAALVTAASLELEALEAELAIRELENPTKETP